MGGDIFVTVEDFEETGKPILTDWARNTEPAVNIHTTSSTWHRTGSNSEYFDLSYKKIGYDYWTKSVNIPLSNPELKIGIRLFLKSEEPSQCILKVNVDYPNQMIDGVWQSDIKKDAVNGWEERRIENLFEKARMIASKQNWDMHDVTINKIILDTQGFSSKFYVDDIELFITRN